MAILRRKQSPKPPLFTVSKLSPDTTTKIVLFPPSKLPIYKARKVFHCKYFFDIIHIRERAENSEKEAIPLFIFETVFNANFERKENGL